MEKSNRNQNDAIKMITWLVGLYLLLTPLDFLPVISGVSLSKILIFIPVCGWILYVTRTKVQFDQLFFAPLVYVIIVMISFFYSYDAADTMQRIVTISMNIGAILVLSMVSYNLREIHVLIKAVVFSGWLTLILMTFYSQVDLFGGLRLTVVVNGVYQDPNYLTGFLIFPSLYYYYDLIENKKKLSLIKMCVFLIFILLTGSRGGLLALVGATLLLTVTWIVDKGFRMSSVVKIFSVLLLFIAVIAVAVNVLPEEIVNRYNVTTVVESGGTGRFAIWTMAIENFSNFSIFNKLFGCGAGTIAYFTGGIVAHNLWLESLLEIGALGTLVLFIFYYVYLNKAYAMKEYVVAASFFGYIIMSMSMSLFSFKPIWNIMLLILILRNSKNQLRYSERDSDKQSI